MPTHEPAKDNISSKASFPMPAYVKRMLREIVRESWHGWHGYSLLYIVLNTEPSTITKGYTMNGPKIHKHANGFETFICSKCKVEKERLNGYRTSGQANIPRFKWLCDLCYAEAVMNH